MAMKLTSRTIYWLITLAVLTVFVSSYAWKDLATKHLMHDVKIEDGPLNRELYLSNLSPPPANRTSDDIRDISPSKSNGFGDDKVDYELSSFTDERRNERFDKDEKLSHTVEDANGGKENDHVSVLDITNVDGSSDDVRPLYQNSSFRNYDPQVYIDLYRNQTISEGSMKITDSPPIIFIMAQWRFGSSVFGQLFNQNSDLFYLFEPLWPTNQLRKKKGIGLHTPESQQMSRDILRKLSRCYFDADFVKLLNNWNGKVNNKEICRATSQTCSLISPTWMSEFCRKFKGRVAAKLVRADLETLKPLVVDDNINLKVIHLVRDPRGSATSRINYTLKLSEQALALKLRSQFPKLGRLKPLNLFSTTPETSTTVRGMCQWIRENAIVSPDLLPAWLQDRYYLVRYEDFADTPLKVTKELYKFVGIPFHQEVEQWVMKNTHAPTSNEQVFSTYKNSHVAATHWIHDLTKMEVDQIEAECMDVLKLMGYEPYSQLIHHGNS